MKAARTSSGHARLVSTRVGALLAPAILASACALAIGSPSIFDLQRNPARYHDRNVRIDGVVTSSWGIPLVPLKVYKVDDGTGEVTVVSQSVRTPTRGARVRVTGTVNEMAVFGGQALGLHLREKDLDVRR
jgi:hypothetical protein